MSSFALASASGLRPASAFVLIGLVLVFVGAKAASIALVDEGEQPNNLSQDPAPAVAFDLVDRHGTPIAVSVERLELEMSPNAMWQAHTPDKIAAALARVLGAAFTPEVLLERMLPDARKGVIRVEREPFVMNEAEARAVYAWTRDGSTRAEEPAPPIPGIWIRPIEGGKRGKRGGEYALDWIPALVLSEKTRAEHGENRALDWTRRIADELFVCLYGRDAFEAVEDEDERNDARRRIWDALLPSQFKSVIKEVSPEVAIELFELLKAERIRDHQMRLVRNAKRMYPVQGGRKGGKGDPPVAVLGRWGTLEPETARVRAREELLLPDDEHLTDRERDQLVRETRVKIYQPSPMSGLELLCDRLLRRPEWSFLERRREEYTFLANQVPRQPLQRYFQELIPASETPHVVTTLDMRLQRHLRACLEQLMVEHKPAAAMAIAIELETNAVIAVDAIDPYGMGGFLPTMHTFTPGSTIKPIVMATALDAGVLRLDERIDTCDGNFRVGSRTITEAENQRTGRLTPAEGLAYSCNAVLVQIGLRIPMRFFRDHLVALGYGEYPGAGLGGERRGRLSELPWKPRNTHASVSYGYETSVTLWQHAAALAAIVRGGEWRPLSLVEAVEQNGVRHPITLAPGRRVFTPESCAIVRDMMELGAREGTGKRVSSPDLVMGTKTGTAQKVADEVCLHVELEHNRRHGCLGARACRRTLVGKKEHRSHCYTSSMCAFGRLPDGDREVFVLVVVDEPRGTKKYGADVAGEAAVSILEEALGHRRGATVTRATGATAQALALDLRAGLRLPRASDRPWVEDDRAAR